MKPLLAANWKMNLLRSEAEALAAEVGQHVVEYGDINFDVLVCPSFIHIAAINEILAGSPVALGAQNVNQNGFGAHTGEVNSEMLKQSGCSYVIVGHSERRANHSETDELTRLKAESIISIGMTAIVCLGETLAEREEKKTLQCISKQLSGSLPSQFNGQNLVIAYEPVWAIGSGLTPNLSQIEEVHSEIRSQLNKYSNDANDVRILYGGSVNPANSKTILSVKNVDGGLIGGASLNFNDFWTICLSVL